MREFIYGLFASIFYGAPDTGKRYILRGDISDPFSDPLIQKVLDVKDGWVKYEKCPPYKCLDSTSSLKISTFNGCYKKLDSK
jgi:hypothetical protein